MRYKNILQTSLLSALIIIGFSSCDENNEMENGSLTMNFALEYEGEPVDLYADKMPYLEDSVFFTKFELFLSNAQLLDPNSENAELFNYKLISFVNNESSSITTIQLDELENGSYEALSLGIGVDSIANSLSPEEQDQSSALSRAESYWPGWNSYIFSKTEGKIITSDSLSNFSYHTGSDVAYRTKTFNTTITINAGEATEINFVIDLKRIFKKEDSHYDLLSQAGLHNEGDQEDMNRVSDNIKNAVNMVQQ